MAWIELKFSISNDAVNDLTELLNAHGALAVTLQDAADQPQYEPDPLEVPLWDNIILTGLFPQSYEIKPLMEMIQQQYPALAYQVNLLEDQDWERTWMEDFHPMRFGQRLAIVPSYQQAAIAKHQVLLDPGLAFGTGKHATTALCLRFLDEVIQGNETIIDYGCGSGILGIAALKLGAAKVWAIDHDPQALLATRQNADKNDISAQQLLTFMPKQFEQPPEPASLLIANILANPLIELAPKFAHLTQGQIALSGILKEQVPSILEAYEPWFKISQVVSEEDWVLMIGSRL